MIQGSEGYYGTAGAVSAAAPITTGAIALMLQMNPSWTLPGVKRILQQTARSDTFTGATPNTTWGYGKLDVYAAVAKAFSESPQAATRTARLSNLSILTECRHRRRFVHDGLRRRRRRHERHQTNPHSRGAGPSLAPLGVTGPLDDPKLGTLRRAREDR